MSQFLTDKYAALIRSVAELPEVTAIGKSGGAGLPADGGDIDLYVFCSQIPGLSVRQAVVHDLGDAAAVRFFSENSGRWGIIDIFTVEKTEICLIYFTEAEMDADIESVLNGSRLRKETDGFYPTGRCATMLSLHALYDRDGYIAGMRERLAVYPPELAAKTVEFHIRKANDEESFGRAVARADVLFYHETVENAIDHFLQALFALNGRFFPGRKRTAQHVSAFGIAPGDCVNRLLKVIELGARPETLRESYGQPPKTASLDFFCPVHSRIFSQKRENTLPFTTGKKSVRRKERFLEVAYGMWSSLYAELCALIKEGCI